MANLETQLRRVKQQLKIAEKNNAELLEILAEAYYEDIHSGGGPMNHEIANKIYLLIEDKIRGGK